MHPHMALSIDECVELSHLKERITAVIPTSTANLNCLMWSVFSLLTRSDHLLEHICVCINGPDPRTGETAIQDEKQAFLEELRDIEFYNINEPDVRRSMPLTVIRTWSRVGWAESLEQALPWVHTDAYLFMHDDAFVTSSAWTREVRAKFYGDDAVALASVPPLLGCGVDHHIHRGMYMARLPQLETTFLVCKKKWIMKAGAPWTGYHIPSDDNVCQFGLDEIDKDEFLSFWRDKGLLVEPFQETELYNFVRQEVGSWVYYKLCQNGNKFAELSSDLIVHLKGMTLPGGDKEGRIEANRDKILELEDDIHQHPEFSALYRKYKKG
jgi:hypothetical protein